MRLCGFRILKNKGIGAYAALDLHRANGAACGNTTADLYAGGELTMENVVSGGECGNGDMDDDGISDLDELGAPDFGDGNADGIMDDLQNIVASFPMDNEFEYITLESSPNASLEKTIGWDFCRLPDPPPEMSLTALDYIDFTVSGIDPGGSVTVKIMFHGQATQPGSFHR